MKKANKVTSLKSALVHGIQSKRFCDFYEYEVGSTALFLKKIQNCMVRDTKHGDFLIFFSLSSVRFVGDTSAALSAQYPQHTRKNTVGKIPHILGNMKEVGC